jgi:hypothetical protein
LQQQEQVLNREGGFLWVVVEKALPRPFLRGASKGEEAAVGVEAVAAVEAAAAATTAATAAGHRRPHSLPVPTSSAVQGVLVTAGAG